MRKVLVIIVALISYLAFYFIWGESNYLYIKSSGNIETSVMPIDNYSEIVNGSKNYLEEEKSYIEKRKKIFPKEVFLTFDDGPSSNNTLTVLKILKSNNVKATFFVIGSKVQQYPDIIKTLSDSGMCIMPHTYSHNYKIYKNVSSYFEDLEACKLAIQRITGERNQYYTRLPGGSDNLVANRLQMKNIKNTLKGKYIYYVDWNVSSADAASVKVAMERIRENVINQCSSKKLAVVLMHDSSPKTTSAEALPYIIKHLKNQGFEFRTFNDITPAEEKLMIKEGIINR